MLSSASVVDSVVATASELLVATEFSVVEAVSAVCSVTAAESEIFDESSALAVSVVINDAAAELLTTPSIIIL